MKLKSVLSALILSVITYGIVLSFYDLKKDKTEIQSTLKIETPAFFAQQENTNWVINLKSEFFSKETKLVAIIYNEIFYGVFLLSDKIYLPILVAPTIELMITSLNEEGKPLVSQSFKLE